MIFPPKRNAKGETNDMDMIFCPLYSGSSGNCLYVQYGETRLLIDAGKSGKMIQDALAYIGVAPESLSAILITHEHDDHIKSAGVLARRFHLPVYATEGTWLGMEKKVGEIPADLRRTFDKREDFYLGQIGVVPFATPHDAMDPVGFRFYGGGVSMGIATDLGYFAQDVKNALAGSDLVLLESNHDPDLLRMNDHYNARLKQRILGRKGHLSNQACAEALVQLVGTGVRNVILGHLSGENNRPELALSTNENYAELEGIRLGVDLHLDLAWRDRVGGVYTLREGM